MTEKNTPTPKASVNEDTPQEQKVLSAEDYINSVSKQRGDNLVISKQEAARHLELFAKQKMLEMLDELTMSKNYNQDWELGFKIGWNNCIETIKSRIDGKE